MKQLIFTIALLLSCFPNATSSTANGLAQASATGNPQADVDELKDVVDAANLLIFFKAFVNSEEMKEDSEFGGFLGIQEYHGPKEYAFQETRSAETVWYKNCTLKRNSPLPQTYAKGTTSIVSLESTMGGGWTVNLSVFNENAANQVKRQVKRLDVKVSDNYDNEADVYIVYDASNKCWTMSCNQFSEFITRDEENPQPYLTAKLLPSLINYNFYIISDCNYFVGLGFQKLREDFDEFRASYGHHIKINNMDDYDNFDRWFTPNDKSAIGIIESYDGAPMSFIFYNKQLFDEMKAKVTDMGYVLSTDSNQVIERYVKTDNDTYFIFEQKSACYKMAIAIDYTIEV